MEPLGGIISELGRTQYNLGAVVLTLKAMGLSLGFWIVTLCLTTRVKGPFFFLKKKKEKYRFFNTNYPREYRQKLSNLLSKLIVSSRLILIDILL
jgi:hypothetical protein